MTKRSALVGVLLALAAGFAAWFLYAGRAQLGASAPAGPAVPSARPDSESTATREAPLTDSTSAGETASAVRAPLALSLAVRVVDEAAQQGVGGARLLLVVRSPERRVETAVSDEEGRALLPTEGMEGARLFVQPPRGWLVPEELEDGLRTPSPASAVPLVVALRRLPRAPGVRARSTPTPVTPSRSARSPCATIRAGRTARATRSRSCSSPTRTAE